MNKTLTSYTAFLARAVRKIFACCLMLLLGVTTASISPSPALAVVEGGFVDMVFVVDESGSMSGEHEWLKDTVVELENAFQAANIGVGNESNRYGLVGFGMGDRYDPPEAYQVGNGLLGRNSELVTALDKLALSGSFEDGYAGLDDALSIYPFRDRASVNIVLVTDEDRDIANSSLNYQTILSKLKSHAALLNVVANVRIEDASGQQAVGIGKNDTYIANGQGGFTLSSGGTIFSNAGSTKTDYADLALATQSSSANGAVWDLNQLHDGGLVADSFTKAFIAAKVKEVRNSIVILDDGEGTFEVCANNEVGTLVITDQQDNDGGDYCIEPFHGYEWSPGNGLYYTHDGEKYGIPEPLEDASYPNQFGYSLVIEDKRYPSNYGFGNGYREFSIYSKDIFSLKMNDVINQFEDNSGCLKLHYRYRGPVGGPLTEGCNEWAEE